MQEHIIEYSINYFCTDPQNLNKIYDSSTKVYGTTMIFYNPSIFVSLGNACFFDSVNQFNSQFS